MTTAPAPFVPALDSALLARYDGLRLPRYTSYPTAPHFTPAVGADVYGRWLGATDPAAVAGSLYVHVPFCKEMCWYCGCHTKIVARYAPIAEYLGLLHREIAMVAGALPGRLGVRHVHFGGGTPTMLAPADFEALIATLRERFAIAPDAEIAVEIDPRTLTAEIAAALGRSGVNRASLGVQDFAAEVQAAINRHQPLETTRQALDWLAEAGIRHINLDLMYGLPRQTPESAARSAEIAVALAPARLSVFGYAHVPWMKTHQKRIVESELADGAGRWQQFAAIAAILTDAGYVPVGLDHFARADDELATMQQAGRLRRNFQGYTTDDADVLLGFGASSIGALPQGYIQNAVPFDHWADAIAAGRLATAKGLALTAEDRMRRDVIERLMSDLSVDLAAVARRHGAPADHFAHELAGMADLLADGVAVLDGSTLSVPETARPLMRVVAARFDTYLSSGVGRHSLAV